MRLPSPIKDETIVYQCMRSTLISAIKGRIQTIVIPAFGGATGRVKPNVIAKYMKAGYEQIAECIKTKVVCIKYEQNKHFSLFRDHI